MRRILPILLLLAASLAHAADKPRLSLQIAPDGTAAVRPIFPGREAGATKYRFLPAEGAVFRLAWVEADGWPAVVDYSWPADFGQVGPGPQPNPVPTPTPPVPPTPDPAPTPVPNVVELWGAVLIEETKDRTPELAALINSPDLAKFFDDAKLIFQPLDQNVKGPDGKPVAELMNYVKRAKKAGLPRLFIVGTKGEVAYEGAVPDDPDALITLVKKYQKGAKHGR